MLHLRPEEYPRAHLLEYSEEGREGGVQEVFINSMKEADYMRNGSAKAVMSLSKEDSTTLWDSLVECELYSWKDRWQCGRMRMMRGRERGRLMGLF